MPDEPAEVEDIMKIGAGGLRVAAPSSRLGPAGSADLESTIKDYLEAPADDEEKGQVKVAGTIAGAEKKGPGRVSNTYPPVFRAKPQESYQEWKRSVEFGLAARARSSL